MSGGSIAADAAQTPGIWLTAKEVNFITAILVEMPFKTAAPIIHLLGSKLMEARNG